jgi:prephenate dehydrogenase
MFASVRVVGAGLIGTSIALALKSYGKKVEIIDIQPAAQLLAVDLVKGEQISQPELILIAVPVDVTEEVVLEQISSNPNSLVCDLSSVKSDLQLKVKQLSGNTKNFISLHPMAGREVSGAEGARADLFDGRAWIAIENLDADDRAKGIVSELIKICSGTAYWMSANEHDEVVASLSHLPQPHHVR